MGYFVTHPVYTCSVVNTALRTLLEMLENGPNIHDLPPGEDLDRAKRMETFFTEVVRDLRTSTDPGLARMMSAGWDLVHNKVAEVAIVGMIQVVSIVIARGGKGDRVVITVPSDWLERIEADITMQASAIVFTMSQVVDFWNDRLLGFDCDTIIRRAKAYEAAFLLEVQRALPTWVPNAYQASVLEMYPEGLSTPSAQPFLYEPKPFISA